MVYGVVYDRIHVIYAPYTTVFGRKTCDRITIVFDRDRIRRNTAKYGDRIGAFSVVNDRIIPVYGRKRPYFVV